MAVLTGGTSFDVVPLFRGKVDVYKWRGKIVARRWPSPPRYPPTPGTILTRTNMQTAMHFYTAQLDVYDVMFARTLPPAHRDWMDIVRRATMLQATAGVLEQPPMPVAIDVHILAGPPRIEAVCYIWPTPAWNDATVHIQVIPYSQTPPGFRYVPRPIVRTRENPFKEDWALDISPFKDPTSAVWDPIAYTLTITALTDLQNISITAWPGSNPAPTPADANQYPLSPAYDSSLFPTIPEAAWPPPPGAKLADYIHWLDPYR